MNEIIKLGIAEDQALVLAGYIRMLQDYPSIKILYAVSDGKELLKSTSLHQPEIILLDIQMPVMGGIGVLRKLKTAGSDVKILILSAHGGNEMIAEYVKLGAKGYLDKSCTVDTLVNAITSVRNGGTHFTKETTKFLEKHGLFPGDKARRLLTEKEMAILKLISKKKSFPDIAKLTGLDVTTISWYERHLFRKTQTENLEELIAYGKTLKL